MQEDRTLRLVSDQEVQLWHDRACGRQQQVPALLYSQLLVLVQSESSGHLQSERDVWPLPQVCPRPVSPDHEWRLCAQLLSLQLRHGLPVTVPSRWDRRRTYRQQSGHRRNPTRSAEDTDPNPSTPNCTTTRLVSFYFLLLFLIQRTGGRGRPRIKPCIHLMPKLEDGKVKKRRGRPKKKILPNTPDYQLPLKKLYIKKHIRPKHEPVFEVVSDGFDSEQSRRSGRKRKPTEKGLMTWVKCW